MVYRQTVNMKADILPPCSDVLWATVLILEIVPAQLHCVNDAIDWHIV